MILIEEEVRSRKILRRSLHLKRSLNIVQLPKITILKK